MIMSRKQKRFELLVREVSGDLFRYAYWMCKDTARAEDLVQETFYRAWRSFENLRDQNSAKAWLITILRREHARYYAQQSVVEVDICDVQSQLEGGEDPVRHAQSTELHWAIMDLDQQFREPLILQIGAGLTGDEIAKQLGINLNTVNMRLYRARQQLRERYQSAGRSLTKAGITL